MDNKIYDQIYPFCKVRNVSHAGFNDLEPTPRVQFLEGLIARLGIQYEVDQFFASETPMYNIVLRGSSSRAVIAHHDIINPDSDNANDNSASVINAIALKLLVPEINVFLVDGEEIGGLGSQRIAEEINMGSFGPLEWVLNLELTGIGGERFMIGDYPGPLHDRIRELFNPPVFKTPFNDSVILRSAGIDSCVINPLPLAEGADRGLKWKDEGFLDLRPLSRCHSMRDSLTEISTADMQAFVERVLVPIVR
jgi:hypothetical protein